MSPGPPACENQPPCTSSRKYAAQRVEPPGHEVVRARRHGANTCVIRVLIHSSRGRERSGVPSARSHANPPSGCLEPSAKASSRSRLGEKVDHVSDEFSRERQSIRPMIFADLSISLEGFVAGPDPSQEEPLGKGGMELHEWAINSFQWREAHGHEGGEQNVDSDLIGETIARAGAGVMGRKMFSGGSGGWEDDPNPHGWWGENPPFHHHVFVLTHHAREPLEMEGGTTFHFITGGIEEAFGLAREAAGEKDIQIHGGGTAVQQALAAGPARRAQHATSPRVLLGSGYPLLAGSTGRLERTRVIESPSGVTHIRYRVQPS